MTVSLEPLWRACAPYLVTIAQGLGGAGAQRTAVTDSTPQACFSGLPTDYVLHPGANGALLDATYCPAQSFTVFAMRPAADGSVQLVVNATTSSNGISVASIATSLTSQIRFGSSGWIAAPRLSPEVVNRAAFVSPGGIAG